MIELIKVDEKGKLTMTPEVMTILEFRKVYMRDRYRGNEHKCSREELVLIKLFADRGSPYFQYDDDMRMRKLTEDIMERKYKGWKPDAVIWAAIKKYQELTVGASRGLLYAARNAAYRMRKYFEGMEPKEVVDKDGVFDVRKTLAENVAIVKAMKDITDVVRQLDAYGKLVDGENVGSSDDRIQGGGGVGLFEDAESAVWLKR